MVIVTVRWTPAVMLQAAQERLLAMKGALSCLQGELGPALARLEAAYFARLDITQTIIDALYS